MRAAEIADASANAGVDQFRLCSALQVVLPVLEELAGKQNFFVRIFLSGFMAGIREYIRERCA